MKTDNMRYIIEVARYKSISKASQELFINQQHLSKIIKSCENDLGIILFKRTNKGIALTDDGEEIVEKFKQILDLYDSLKERPNSPAVARGSIRLLTEANIWSGYGWLIRGFAMEYPNINITVQNMSTTDIFEELHHNDCIGLIFTTNQTLSSLDTGDDLIFTQTTSGNINVFADSNSPYLHKHKTLSLSTLSKLPMINYKPYNNSPTIMELIFEENGYTPQIKYEVSDRQVFNDLMQKSGYLFFGLKRPLYINKDGFGEIRLRDNIQCISGIVQKKYDPNPVNKLFADYYKKFCKSKY